MLEMDNENVVQDSDEIAYEQRLNDINAIISNSIKLWKNLNEKSCKLLKNIMDNRIRIMGNKWSKNNEKIDENMILATMDEILRDSDRLISNLSKFSVIIERLKPIPSKMSALNQLALSSNNLHTKMLIEHIRENLPHLIFAFQQEMAFRKNSIKDFALTDDKNILKLIYSAWNLGIYTKDIFMFFPFP